jgi:hypothetical protein
MINLLKETKEILKKNNKKLGDIAWFGSKKDELKGELEQLLNFEYNNGFGCQEVFKDLILVGKDFWLERHEYDGSEWWEYKTQPERPKETHELGIRNLKIDYETARLISEDEDYDYYPSLIKE